MQFTSFAVIGLASAAVASHALAVTFPAPAFFGSANTTFQQWEGFSSPAGPNAATTVTNPAGTPNWYDRTHATDGAFLIGTAPTGRVYSFGGIITPEVTVPTPVLPGGTTDVVLQTQTLGTGLNVASFYALPAGGGSPVLASDVTVVTTGTGMGAANTYVVTWDDLPGAAGYTLTYAADGSSSSHVGARVDTLTSVPEPAALAGLAGAGAFALRRRRRV